jgi:sodium transport system permease protein
VLSFEEVPVSASEAEAASEAERFARQAVQQGEYEVAIHFPRGFAEKLAQFRRQSPHEVAQAEASPEKPEVPGPRIYFSTAKERSTITYSRVLDVLQRWREALGRETLAALGLPESTARPFDIEDEDLAELAGRRGAAVWSKILPCLLLLFALTGAFYPAIDLCAGEKERGTLETLLISPAERTEIVWGKLLTVMLFSVAMSVLNLVSMGFTSHLVLSQLREFGPPPALAPLWLLLALLPVSALFSALCLALASLARSSKEGQYYLMPLLLVTMPLVLLPLSPGFDLNLGNSLIPITGVMLLLRTVLEGNYWQALPYVPLVAGVTLFCCLLAVRWAVDQFNSESVLFRESERLDLGLWLKHLLRDREDTPNVAAALFCGVLILLVQFFMNVTLARHMVQASFEVVALVTQLAAIATPALLMTVMLARSPRQTLLLRLPTLAAVPLAVLLAVSLHPVANALQTVVVQLYPLSDTVKQQLEGLLGRSESLGLLLFVVAVVPALCEELAFRGFILSGLRHLGHTRRAIALSAIFFGLAHTIFQQSILAFIMGLVLGYLAVQTGSLLPGVLFHMTHNALGVLSGQLKPELLQRWPALSWMVDDPSGESFLYRWPVIVLGALLGLMILLWFRQLPHARTREEALQQAIEHNDPQLAADLGLKQQEMV